MHDITTAISPVAESEQTLRDAITELWSVHVEAQTVMTKTKEELKIIRHNLGQRLHAMKQLLARPGRGGQWRSFLAARGIPRTTADRYVREHDNMISPAQRCTTESIQEPSEIQLSKLVFHVWSKCEKVLPTSRSRYELMRGLMYKSGLAYDLIENGVLLYEPGCEPARPDALTPDHAADDGEVL